MGFLAPLALAAGAGGGTAALGGSLATALAVGGTVLSGVSQFQQASYQRQVAKINAAEATRAANLEAEAAQREALRSDREFRALLGEQLAAQGASGLGVGSSSFGRVRRNTLRVRGEQAGDIIRSGAESSRNLFRDAANFRGEANAAGSAAFNALAGTIFAAGGEIGKGVKSGEFKRKKSIVGGARSTR